MNAFWQVSRRIVMIAVWVTLAAGCAHVAFEPGAARLDDKALVFGHILLERDGERDVISAFSTPIVIRQIDTAAEPGLVTQSFDKDGGFYWALRPGHYQLSIALSRYESELVSFAFTIDRAKTAYYFGDLVIAGTKRFDTIGGANIRKISPRFEDHFDQAQAALLARNPQLEALPRHRLVLKDMKDPHSRWLAYHEVMAAGASCCARLAELPYDTLTFGETSTKIVDLASPVFDFDGERSRFLAWALPRTGTPYAITIRSVVTPSNLPALPRFYIFAPTVTLLDAEFRVLATWERGRFVPQPASMLPLRQASIQAHIPLVGALACARYLILHTTQSVLESEWSTWMPGFVPIAGGVLPTGLPEPVSMEAAISGEVQVTAMPITP